MAVTPCVVANPDREPESFCAVQVLIVEEAAEVLEAEILTSASPSLEHVILIGETLGSKL